MSSLDQPQFTPTSTLHYLDERIPIYHSIKDPYRYLESTRNTDSTDGPNGQLISPMSTIRDSYDVEIYTCSEIKRIILIGLVFKQKDQLSMFIKFEHVMLQNTYVN